MRLLLDLKNKRHMKTKTDFNNKAFLATFLTVVSLIVVEALIKSNPEIATEILKVVIYLGLFYLLYQAFDKLFSKDR